MRYKELQEARLRQGITQEEMSRMLGFHSRNAYALKERGLRRFYVDESLKIAQVLNQPVEALFSTREG